MNEEMHAIQSNNTWDLVSRPPNANVVGSKWGFRTKFRADGTIERYKAQLVAQGFTQIPGNISHNFSSIVKATTVQVILAPSLHHQDVNNALLNGTLSKPVYMAQPSGFIDPHFSDHVCQLKKALYGLRQAPFAWFHRFITFLSHMGFRESQSDLSLFFLHRRPSIIYLLLYVDDIILTGNDPTLLGDLIQRIHREFSIKDLGQLSYFLGLGVSYTPHGLFLGQSKYSCDILDHIDLLDSKPVSTPQVADEILVNTSSSFSNPILYRSIVGALQYHTITCPDLSFTINLVSQFLHSPIDDHF
ncbi:unnamed protein product [Cuscuta europaea]|uniref:Reverse transcriptase Ty1/copia-type domain-containing protein n=1 Tax=Cuscuta europaea TaxID=41803 RepID=A0A9P0YWE3_CUSEU|nr:unnamed protein product [Cuscuta europaea]